MAATPETHAVHGVTADSSRHDSPAALGCSTRVAAGPRHSIWRPTPPEQSSTCRPDAGLNRPQERSTHRSTRADSPPPIGRRDTELSNAESAKIMPIFPRGCSVDSSVHRTTPTLKLTWRVTSGTPPAPPTQWCLVSSSRRLTSPQDDETKDALVRKHIVWMPCFDRSGAFRVL